MNVKKHVYNYLNRIVSEGIDETGTPDTKYYAFDWDDNIVYMPTQIIVLTENDDEIGMSTEDFAEHRHKIGVEPFYYKGTTVVGFAKDSFKFFKEMGDKRFVIDSMLAKPGPSWNDFVECINGGSIFAIITARGHNPSALREGVYNFIVSNHNGINSKLLVENLKKYRNFFSEVEMVTEQIDVNFSDKELIDEYLDLCVYEPVTFGQGSAANPEKLKIIAMRKFISYCQGLADEIGKKAYFKNGVANNEIILQIGFSDDDEGNVKSIDNLVSQEYPDVPISVYLTKGDEKVKYNK